MMKMCRGRFMVICKEMFKLREYLNIKNIKCYDRSDNYINRTAFYINDVEWSVINGFGTYGGIRGLNKVNQGLLELAVGDAEPTGWLNANDIIERIENSIN